MNKMIRVWFVVIAVFSLLSTTIIPHHHHHDGERICSNHHYNHSDFGEHNDTDCPFSIKLHTESHEKQDYKWLEPSVLELICEQIILTKQNIIIQSTEHRNKFTHNSEKIKSLAYIKSRLLRAPPIV